MPRIAFKFLFLVVLSVIIFPQKKSERPSGKVDVIRNEAIRQMNIGKYGEAIDLLNKVVSAYPQEVEGYNLRGLSYEKRDQLMEAVYDFRAARRIAPNNQEVAKNLARATKNWYDQLYQKIEGHRREIAINPAKPVNYLEIGKCYKHLGQWVTAEEWYDEYLKREEGSADEIIRYTEILARNNHIEKGEKILKIYVSKYPEDHRLWSRYGYFTLWLGKKKIALEAFEKALSFRPYFKEAMDGYDLARDKGYTYTYFDTTYRKLEKQRPQEYTIDKYYRMLKRDPVDSETRFALVNELKKVNRIEEAYEQLVYMQPKLGTTERFTTLWDAITVEREKLFNQRKEDYTKKFEKNPSNKEAALFLADAYANLSDFDGAIGTLEKYLQAAPGEHTDVTFKIAQYSAWNKDWEKANNNLDQALKSNPDNLEYQLLRGQLSVWTQKDLDVAEGYLNNYLGKNPNSMEALLGLGALYLQKRDFPKSEQYANTAFGIDSTSEAVAQLMTSIEFQKMRAEQDRLFGVLNDGRNLYYEGKCEEALPKYEEFLSKTENANVYQKEFADVQSCAKNYSTAISIYDQLLNQNYDFDVALARANAYYYSGDSLNALNEFKKLSSEQPVNVDVKILLGDSYAKNRMYSEAEDTYEALLDSTKDSTQIALLTQRLGWLPPTGLNSFFATFPNYVGLSPYAFFYKDNQNLDVKTFGGRVELGLTNYLSGSIGLQRTNFTSPTATAYLTTFKWSLYFRITGNLLAGAGFGSYNLNSGVRRKGPVSDFFIRFEKKDVYSASFTFEDTDAALAMFSNYLVNNRFNAKVFKFNGQYESKTHLRLSGYYGYITLSDGNKGNDLQMRIGKKFYDQVYFGYEYYYAQYHFIPYLSGTFTPMYYAPQNFESHSLWTDIIVEKSEDFMVSIGGRLGYIPLGDSMLRELYFSGSYNPISRLVINGRLGFGSTFRYDYSYNSVSASLSAYWSF
ncbi:MAG: tetratricopeptide repeat protein [Ignavibacteriaceae bacterium]|nr:tetratricopeptide repeat protein [Ignavibacteriaceae bacterium]